MSPREGNLIAQFAFAFQEGYLASSRDEAGAALRGVVDDQLIVTVVKIGDRKDVYRNQVAPHLFVRATARRNRDSGVDREYRRSRVPRLSGESELSNRGVRGRRGCYPEIGRAHV